MQQALRAGSLDGRMRPDQWVAILHEAVRDVIQRRDWQHAFAGNGLLGDSGRIRNSLLEDLGSQLPLPLVPPTDEQLCAIVGRHRVALSGQLLNEASAIQWHFVKRLHLLRTKFILVRALCRSIFGRWQTTRVRRRLYMKFRTVGSALELASVMRRR